MAKKAKEKQLIVAASYHLHGANEWSKKGRRAIANWLRQAAKDLEELGDQYSPRFRGRYHVHPK